MLSRSDQDLAALENEPDRNDAQEILSAARTVAMQAR